MSDPCWPWGGIVQSSAPVREGACVILSPRQLCPSALDGCGVASVVEVNMSFDMPEPGPRAQGRAVRRK